MNVRHFKFQSFVDERGSLSVGEFGSHLPFPVRRVYYIYGVGENQRRGFHAHRKLEQVFFCPSGSCKIMLDDGASKDVVLLDRPDSAIYVGPGIWREMYDFEPNTVLIVLASEIYDENDYIRSYDEFMEAVR